MNTREKGAPAQLNPTRLREITKRFVLLKTGSLNNVLFGLMILSLQILEVERQWWWAIVPLLGIALGGVVIGRGYVPRYYEHRFGIIEAPTMSNSGCVTFILVLVGLMIFGRALGTYVEALWASVNPQLHAAISDPQNRVDFVPILWCALFLIVSLWANLEGLRRRKPFSGLPLAIVFFGTLLWTAVFFYPLHHPEITQFLLWRFVAKGWFGISLIGIGLYEHWQLASLLPRRTSENDDDNE